MVGAVAGIGDQLIGLDGHQEQIVPPHRIVGDAGAYLILQTLDWENTAGSEEDPDGGVRQYDTGSPGTAQTRGKEMAETWKNTPGYLP
ncbi:hypothetical protein [Nocardia niwae]|uniref:hypothetical protein n=1 Tax=Nocardia niwae TaxID=626084 RepID=UPI0033EB4B7B